MIIFIEAPNDKFQIYTAWMPEKPRCTLIINLIYLF